MLLVSNLPEGYSGFLFQCYSHPKDFGPACRSHLPQHEINDPAATYMISGSSAVVEHRLFRATSFFEEISQHGEGGEVPQVVHVLSAGDGSRCDPGTRGDGPEGVAERLME